MNHIKIEQTSTIELVNYRIIRNLVVQTQNCDSSSNLKGSLRTPTAYTNDVTFLHNKFSQLSIIAQDLYINFEDSRVEQVLTSSIGDGIGITQQQAQDVTTLNDLFLGPKVNTPHFKELKYFTNVKYINTFKNTSLVSIDMQNIETIDSYQFKYCTNLRYIGSLRSVKEIRNNAFEDTSFLEFDLELPSYNSYLMSGAIFKNSGILSISNLSSTITQIENDVFLNCQKLEYVDLTGTRISSNNSITNTFYGCSSIKVLKLPSTFTLLTTGFCMSSVLETIVCYATKPPGATGPVPGVSLPNNPNIKVYVPDGSVSSYQQHSAWSTYTILPISQYVEE